MEPLIKLYPDAPAWTLQVTKNQSLPEGIYTFVEFYCGNPECDCKAGLFDMLEVNHEGKVLGGRIASIHYSWDQPISELNPNLENEQYPSQLTKAALNTFLEEIQNDASRIDTIKAHYAMVKEYFVKNPARFVSEDYKSFIGSARNKPCPCGSGKKYKKCCL